MTTETRSSVFPHVTDSEPPNFGGYSIDWNTIKADPQDPILVGEGIFYKEADSLQRVSTVSYRPSRSFRTPVDAFNIARMAATVAGAVVLIGRSCGRV